MLTLENINETINSDVSPYGLAKMLGVQGPMMYTYAKKGLHGLKTYKTSTGKLAISKDEARRFVEVFLTKKMERQSKTNA